LGRIELFSQGSGDLIQGMGAVQQAPDFTPGFIHRVEFVFQVADAGHQRDDDQLAFDFAGDDVGGRDETGIGVNG
jgi:hypothetical protein